MIAMMRECDEHGYFRGERCPECDAEGRFLMNEGELESLSRTLTGILRHFPERFDLDMDDQGWIEVDDIVEQLRNRQRRFHWLSYRHIEAIVDTDEKGRYQLDDGLIRATYGHSLDLDLDLPTDDIPDKLYYPTTDEEVDIVLETGLNPSDRSKVHLSLTYAKAREAGRVRVEDPIILEVDARTAVENGVVIMRAGTSVFITRGIPQNYLSKAERPADFVDEPRHQMRARRDRPSEDSQRGPEDGGADDDRSEEDDEDLDDDELDDEDEDEEDEEEGGESEPEGGAQEEWDSDGNRHA